MKSEISNEVLFYFCFFSYNLRIFEVGLFWATLFTIHKFYLKNLYNNKKNISITLRDSYLLLPSSLSKLSTQFRVSTGHGTGQLSGAVQWAVIRH